jgi:hypothetical protein
MEEIPLPVDDVPPVNGVDVLAIIDGAQRPRRSMALCLRGDLVAEYEDLDRQREEAEKADIGDSLASGGSAAAIVVRMDALREEMKASTIIVALEAMTRREFLKLCSMHPVRRDEDGTPNRDDVNLGVNTESVWGPLIRACWSSPVIDKARMTKLLDEKLSDSQYTGLANLAWLVNRGDVDIPFSYPASMTRRRNSPE